MNAGENFLAEFIRGRVLGIDDRVAVNEGSRFDRSVLRPMLNILGSGPEDADIARELVGLISSLDLSGAAVPSIGPWASPRLLRHLLSLRQKWNSSEPLSEEDSAALAAGILGAVRSVCVLFEGGCRK